MKAGLDLSQWLIVGAALATGVLTLFSMMTVFGEVFWKDVPDGETSGGGRPMSRRERVAMMVPIGFLTAAILVIGLVPQPFYNVANRAAGQLLDPNEYIAAVRGIHIHRELGGHQDDGHGDDHAAGSASAPADGHASGRRRPWPWGGSLR